MKVLILSCNTGQGHNSAGRALMEEFSARGIHADMRDALAFDSPFTSKMVCSIHAKASLHVPKLLGVGIQVANLIDKTKVKHSPCYIANLPSAASLYEFIKKGGYDTVVIPHVFPSETVTHIRKKHPELRIRTYFIGTDYAYPPFLHDTDLDAYIIPHPDLVPDFAAAGVPKDRIFPLGIPVAKVFATRTDKAEARKKLNLPEEGNIVLIMTGSMGFGNTETLVRELLKRCDATFLVMGGNNTRMKQHLRQKYEGESRLRVLDFTKEVSLYMDASDLLFTKPGGLSSTEAAVKGIPFLHTPPIPGWEEDNIRFFRAHGFSEYGKDAEELAIKALYLLANPHKSEDMQKAQARGINKTAAEDICDLIMKGDLSCSG